jgi:hypothetical protein
MDAVLQRHDKEGKVIPTKVGIHCTNKQHLFLAFTMDAVLQRHDVDGKVIPTKVGIHCTNKQYLILAFTVDAGLQRGLAFNYDEARRFAKWGEGWIASCIVYFD